MKRDCRRLKEFSDAAGKAIEEASAHAAGGNMDEAIWSLYEAGDWAHSLRNSLTREIARFERRKGRKLIAEAVAEVWGIGP